MFGRFFGIEAKPVRDQHAINTEHAISVERDRMHQAIQTIESGSRVMATMSGMIQLLTVNARVHDDR